MLKQRTCSISQKIWFVLAVFGLLMRVSHSNFADHLIMPQKVTIWDRYKEVITWHWNYGSVATGGLSSYSWICITTTFWSHVRRISRCVVNMPRWSPMLRWRWPREIDRKTRVSLKRANIVLSTLEQHDSIEVSLSGNVEVALLHHVGSISKGLAEGNFASMTAHIIHCLDERQNLTMYLRLLEIAINVLNDEEALLDSSFTPKSCKSSTKGTHTLMARTNQAIFRGYFVGAWWEHLLGEMHKKRVDVRHHFNWMRESQWWLLHPSQSKPYPHPIFEYGMRTSFNNRNLFDAWCNDCSFFEPPRWDCQHEIVLDVCSTPGLYLHLVLYL